jgi:hypothetical protein
MHRDSWILTYMVVLPALFNRLWWRTDYDNITVRSTSKFKFTCAVVEFDCTRFMHSLPSQPFAAVSNLEVSSLHNEAAQGSAHCHGFVQKAANHSIIPYHFITLPLPSTRVFQETWLSTLMVSSLR